MTDKKTRPMPPLDDRQKQVIIDKGTERPFTGEYWNHYAEGVYVCRQCGAELYNSTSKFESNCGWPSFDDEIPGAVKRTVDADGRRTEITCANCGGHLGHIFTGEGYTDKNVRHCVNSISMVFVPRGEQAAGETAGQAEAAMQEAIFAGGCFWGVEHQFQQVEGVISAVSGYIGGTVDRPTYEQVCTGRTGHAEAVRVTYDPRVVSYEELAKLFFEIHDPTQKNRQGPDVGTQYRSAVFFKTEEQRQTAQMLVQQLADLGYDVTTEVLPAGRFYEAEDYHQDYLDKHPSRYSCHARTERFAKPAKSPSK